MVDQRQWARAREAYAMGLSAVERAGGESLCYYFHNIEHQEGEPRVAPVLKLYIPRHVLGEMVAMSLETLSSSF